MITLSLPVDPTPKGRPRFTQQGRVYTPKRTKSAEDLIKEMARQQYRNGPIKGALSVLVVFTIKRPKSVKRDYPTVKPDLDNCLKLLLDALNGITYDDDAQIIEINVSKKYGQVGNIFIDIKPYLQD